MKNLTTFVYPLITLIVVLLVWHLSILWLHVPGYILPAPASVGTTLVSMFTSGSVWPDMWYTLQSTLMGYVIGCAGAIVLGAILAESPTFEKFIYPFVIAIQAAPKVALAPLLLVWFGFGLASKVVLVVLICFFPLFVNTVIAFRQTDPELIDMCRAFSVSKRYVFLHVKIPAAANSIFAGLQIAVALALIGAVVGEFIASSRGLGYLIASATVNMNVSIMFAGIFVLSLLGIIGTQIVRLLHRWVVFWDGGAADRQMSQTKT
ncbi:MAG: ABC transporter permease [Candidimonas sp.]|nr:MAG: ABC transporter permease [Candidimonas sp.]